MSAMPVLLPNATSGSRSTGTASLVAATAIAPFMTVERGLTCLEAFRAAAWPPTGCADQTIAAGPPIGAVASTTVTRPLLASRCHVEEFGELPARPDRELLVDMAQVRLDRLAADEQRLGDGDVAQA